MYFDIWHPVRSALMMLIMIILNCWTEFNIQLKCYFPNAGLSTTLRSIYWKLDKAAKYISVYFFFIWRYLDWVLHWTGVRFPWMCQTEADRGPGSVKHKVTGWDELCRWGSTTVEDENTLVDSYEIILDSPKIVTHVNKWKTVEGGYLGPLVLTQTPLCIL